MSYGVGSSVLPLAPDPTSLYRAYGIFAPEKLDNVVAAFKDEVSRVLESGFTEDEVDAAIRGYLDSRTNARTNDAQIAGLLRANLYLGRTMNFVSQFEHAVEDLSAAEVHEAMRKYLELGQIAIFTAGDFERVKADN